MAQPSAHIPRGLRNNNPLNLRISGTPWLGKYPLDKNTDGSFEQFDTLKHGIRAALICLRTYMNRYHLNTVQSIISRWAPPSDGNNTRAYVAKVCELTSFSSGFMLSFHNRAQVCRLAWAMAFVECGMFIDNDKFIEAYASI